MVVSRGSESPKDECVAVLENGLELMSEVNYLQPMNERITCNPNQCGGRPCIRGLRVRVKDVLDMLAAKVSRQEILEDFPYLEDEDIDACLRYAAAEADHPVLLTS